MAQTKNSTKDTNARNEGVLTLARPITEAEPQTFTARASSIKAIRFPGFSYTATTANVKF